MCNLQIKVTVFICFFVVLNYFQRCQCHNQLETSCVSTGKKHYLLVSMRETQTFIAFQILVSCPNSPNGFLTVFLIPFSSLFQ